MEYAMRSMSLTFRHGEQNVWPQGSVVGSRRMSAQMLCMASFRDLGIQRTCGKEKQTCTQAPPPTTLDAGPYYGYRQLRVCVLSEKPLATSLQKKMLSQKKKGLLESTSWAAMPLPELNESGESGEAESGGW